MASPIDTLSSSKYVSLTTFKRDGTAVATPVWQVRDGDRLLITTQGSSGKIKRIRNNPRVVLAPCDSRGKLKGDQVEGQAVLQDPDETIRTTKLIAKKYGLLGWLLTRRGGDDRMGITVTVS